MNKKNTIFSSQTGLGIVCFIVGGYQIYRGLEPLDYLPIIIIGFCVIADGYRTKKSSDVD